MRQISEILIDVQSILCEHYPTVIVTTAQINEQINAEIRAIGKHRLPAAIIAFERVDLLVENTLQEVSLAVVIVDQFAPSHSMAAADAIRQVEKLLEVFPPDGRMENGYFITPGAMYAVSSDPNYICFAQSLKIQM